MRPLLLTLALLLAGAATFLALAALGTFGLNRPPAVLATAPTPADNDPAEVPTDDASTAGATIRTDAPGKREPAAAPPGWPRADRPDAFVPPAAPVAAPIDLPALSAVTHGRIIRVEPIPGGFAVGGWRDSEAYVEWDLAAAAAPAAPAPGRYRVELSFACPADAGGRFVLTVGDDALAGQAGPTGGADQFHTTTLGSVRLRPGDTRLTLRPDGRIRGGALMNLRAVRLVPS